MPARKGTSERGDTKQERPKLTKDLEYLGKCRPPWQPFLRLWDNVYDENLGRDKKVVVTFNIIKDGKIISPNNPPQDSQCVAFNVPVQITNKMLRTKVYREYDPSVKFNAERDIVGFVEYPDDAEVLQLRIKKLEEENAEKDRKMAAVQTHLGGQLADKVLGQRGAVTTEKDQLKPSKESLAA